MAKDRGLRLIRLPRFYLCTLNSGDLDIINCNQPRKGVHPTMLSFEHKRTIFSSYSELTETQRSNDRINFEYRGSKKRGKVLACELTASGNGYVLGKYMVGYKLDNRGWINIKDFNEDELRAVITKAIDSMSHP